MPQLIAVMSKVQLCTQSVQHNTPVYYADTKPNSAVESLTLVFFFSYDVPGLDTVLKISYPVCGFHTFPQYLQAHER